jgi:hypothetical protein
LFVEKRNTSDLANNNYPRLTYHGRYSSRPGNTKGGKYHCTVDLLFDLFGVACFANKNKNYRLSYG